MTATVNPFLPQKSYIEVEHYYEPENAAHKGIPFINFVPPLSPKVLNKLMRSDVKVTKEQREAPAHLRIQFLIGLKHLYWPQTHHDDFAWLLWSLVCEGYVTRWRKATAAAKFHAMRQGIANGAPESDDVACFLDSEWCTVLIGTPGTGKSATSRAVLDRLAPDMFYHRQHGAFQVFAVRIQASKNVTAKGLGIQIFRALAAYASKTGHFFPFAGKKPPATLPELEDVIVFTAERLNLGALVIDELQHLYRGTGAMDQEAMKFLTGLVNRLRLPLVLIGTWKCLDLLTIEGRILRRGLSPGTKYFRRMQEDETWEDFFAMLLLKQFVRIVAKDEDGRVRARMYHHCQGIQDIALKLWVIAQIEAITDETEEVTADLIDRVAEQHLPLLAPWIGHLQKGAVENNPSLYDAEPVDFEKYLEALRAQLRGSKKRPQPSDSSEPPPSSAAVMKAAQAVFAAEAGLNPEQALQLSLALAKAAPSDMAASFIQNGLSQPNGKGPKPTKSTKKDKRSAIADAFSRLDAHDIRRIIFEAVQSKEKPGQALQDAGLLANVLDDVAL